MYYTVIQTCVYFLLYASFGLNVCNIRNEEIVDIRCNYSNFYIHLLNEF